MTRYYDPEFEEINFLRGPPACNVQFINIDDKEVDNDRYNSTSPKDHFMLEVINYFSKFLNFSKSPFNFLKDGTVHSRSLGYTINKYCLELEDESDDEWAIMVCANESLQQPSIPILSRT